MRSTILAAVLLTLPLSAVACSASPDHDAATATAEELSAVAPIPFGLQFVDVYDNVGHDGDVLSLELKRTGRYVATFANGTRESGSYRGPAHPAMPFVLKLFTTGDSLTATVNAYDNQLTVTHKGHTAKLRARHVVGPSEDVCDNSGGTWSDDEMDPATWLFCACPSGKSYIPSAGGCVH